MIDWLVGYALNRRLVAAMTAALGPDFEIMVDLNQSWRMAGDTLFQGSILMAPDVIRAFVERAGGDVLIGVPDRGVALALPAVHGLKGHSLVFDTGAAVPPEAVFLEYRERRGAALTPELFPRADGTTYVCAISSEDPLPVDPAQVAPSGGAIERLEAMCRVLSPVLASAKILARQACFRPVTADGLPLIGKVPGIADAYVATGHSVWGILNAPATGDAMAELIMDGVARTVDLLPFDPGRLPRLDPTRLR